MSSLDGVAPSTKDARMRICLLTTQDLDADPFPEDDWPCDPRPFLPDDEWTVVVLEKETSVEQTEQHIAAGYDLYFNLCDGAADEDDVPGIEVVHTLEMHGVPFVGSTSPFYEPSREQMKRACAAEDIATPRHVFARDWNDVERAAEELTFPLFVKHPSSHASIDLSRMSRCVTPAGLRRQARKIMSRHGAALIEEYVDGIECTVLVAENADDPSDPITYTPIQYRFPEGESFKHSDLKWVDFDGMSSFPVPDARLARELREISARFFLALDGASFGRCDIRVDRDGRPFMLEINANCGVYYPADAAGGADICLLHDPAGHAGFTRHLVRAAFARHTRARTIRRSGQRRRSVISEPRTSANTR